MAHKTRHRNRDVSLQDVADAAKVSTMTVSRALRGTEGVSEAKRIEIKRLAKKMQYIPNNNARSLAVSNSTLVGISFPTLFNEVFAEMLEGMRSTFELAGLSTVVNTTDYNRQVEMEWVEHLLSWRPAGVVLTGCDHHRDVRKILRRARIPTLELWDYATKPIDINVGIDHYKAGYRLASYVAGLGYRRPAFVGAPEGKDVRADARKRGIEQAFRERDLAKSMIFSVQSDEYSFVGGQKNTLELMQRKERPDVIFYVNDYIAFGGMSACQSLGIDIPRNVGIVGFNALDITRVLPLALTTASWSYPDLVDTSFRAIMLQEVSNVKTQNTKNEAQVFP